MGFQSKNIINDEVVYPSTSFLDNYKVEDIERILRQYKNKRLTEKLIKQIIGELDI